MTLIKRIVAGLGGVSAMIRACQRHPRSISKCNSHDTAGMALVLGAVRQAAGSFTPGFMLPALFAILCFVVIFKSGSKPDIKTHLVSHGAAA